MTEIKKHWPAWYWGPEGQSAIFNKRAEVPEGWRNQPFGEAEEIHSDEDGADDAADTEEIDDEAGEGDDEEGLPEIDELTVEQIKEYLKDAKVQFNPSWNKERLYNLLKDNG